MLKKHKPIAKLFDLEPAVDPQHVLAECRQLVHTPGEKEERQ